MIAKSAPTLRYSSVTMALTSLFSRPWSTAARLRPRHFQCTALPVPTFRQLSVKPGRKILSVKIQRKLDEVEKDWTKQAGEIKAGRQRHVLDVLEERGFVKQYVGTRQALYQHMLDTRIGVYAGFDPTATSLHLGHLVTLMPLYWLYVHGYGAYTLLGTSTAKIGDPTGRSTDRPTIPRDQLVHNMASIHYQLKKLWTSVERKLVRERGFEPSYAWTKGLISNNAWWNKKPLLDVLQYLGTNVRIGPLLSRDNVKTRIEDGTGMSFSEFAYPLMQGWDWWELFQQRNVQMQIGGSDQYSNILLGAQCVKACLKASQDRNDLKGVTVNPFGLTVPLLTTSSGKKFGKSEGNAIYLDPFQTSPYDMYGYLVRRSDDEVERLLNLLTFLPQDQIAKTMEEHRQNPPKRVAQHLLAVQVLDFVHGAEVAKATQVQHLQMYGAPLSTNVFDSEQTPEQYQVPAAHDLGNGNAIMPKLRIKLPRSLLDSSLTAIVCAAELTVSRGESDRLIKAGGLYIGGSPGQKAHEQAGMGDQILQFTPLKTWSSEWNQRYLIADKLMILRKGKHNIRVIEFIDDAEFLRLGLTYRGQSFLGRLRNLRGTFKEIEKILKDQGRTTDLQNAKQRIRGIELRLQQDSSVAGNLPRSLNSYRKASGEKRLQKMQEEEGMDPLTKLARIEALFSDEERPSPPNAPASDEQLAVEKEP